MIPSLADVCEKALRLPCSPALLPRLITVLEREDSTAEDLEQVIAVDPALASSTLRLANSAFFNTGSDPVDTLQGAVIRLGQREIYRLAALSLAGRWMSQKIDGYGWEPGDFCRLSLVTAVAAEVLAEKTGRVEPKLAYTAGLVHEIGKLAVAYACGEHFGTLRAHQKEQGSTWLQAEKAVLGYTYAEVGGELLRTWRFPAHLVAVALHNPPTASDPVDVLPLVVHVHAAKYLAISMGAGVSEDGFLYSLNTSMLVEWGFTPEVLERALPDVFARSSKLLQEKLTNGVLSF